MEKWGAIFAAEAMKRKKKTMYTIIPTGNSSSFEYTFSILGKKGREEKSKKEIGKKKAYCILAKYYAKTLLKKNVDAIYTTIDNIVKNI